MKKPHSRSGVRFYITWIALILNQYTPATILAGTPILLLGALLHLWAKGCLRQDDEVTRSGPYRFVRHPFYLAYLLIDTGIVIMSGSWILAAVFPVWWLAIYIPTMRKEEAFLEGKFPGVLTAYRRRVPMLLPIRRPLPKPASGFSWDNPNISSGNEIPRFLHILAYPLLFYVVDRFIEVGAAFFHNDGPGDIAWLSLMLFLFASSWMTKRHFYRKQRILPPGFSTPGVCVAFAVSVLLVGLCVDIYEWKLNAALVTLASLLFVGSIALTRWGRTPVMTLAEGLAVVGALIICELPWLALGALLFYVAYTLDFRLIDRSTTTHPSSREMKTLPVRRGISAAMIGLSAIVAFSDYYL